MSDMMTVVASLAASGWVASTAALALSAHALRGLKRRPFVSGPPGPTGPMGPKGDPGEPCADPFGPDGRSARSARELTEKVHALADREGWDEAEVQRILAVMGHTLDDLSEELRVLWDAADGIRAHRDERREAFDRERDAVEARKMGPSEDLTVKEDDL